MAGRTLTQLDLNRALLARQLLLGRATLPLPEAVDRVGGLQTQYAPSLYVGLWTRVADVRRADVTAALEDRTIVQGSLHRVTIHAVSRSTYWLVVAGIRGPRRRWLLRVNGRTDAERAAVEGRLVAAADALREALAGGPQYVRDLGGLADGFVGNAGLWADLVRVPPSGTWERRRADRLALAEQWVGRGDVPEADGRMHLVRAYLGAFGPASWKDIATWAGLTVTEARAGGADLDLAAYRDEDGRPLVDIPGGPLPDATTPAPVRFLPHWDATLLVHARRTGLLPEAHRGRLFTPRNPASLGAVMVEGRVVGGWRVRDGEVRMELFEELSSQARDAVEAERLALERFHA
jgi:hypothetical protein